MKEKSLWKIKREYQLRTRVSITAYAILWLLTVLIFVFSNVSSEHKQKNKKTIGLTVGFSNEIKNVDVSAKQIKVELVDTEVEEVKEPVPECPYSIDDLEALSHLIYAEAGSDYIQDSTLYYVGSVVLNRVNSDLYPDTIKGVIEDDKFGIQYSCKDYYMNLEPTERCYEIAEDLLVNGSTIPSNVLGQAEFKQFDEVWAYQDGIYFCYLNCE